MARRKYDIILHEASGFTGRFITQYLGTRQLENQSLRWAIAGRSPDKFRVMTGQLELQGVSIIEAHATSEPSIMALARAWEKAESQP